MGYERTENFAGGAVRDKRNVYTAPARLGLNQWALSGDWTMKKGLAALNAPNGRIVNQFHARDLHLVMGPSKQGTSVRFRVTSGRPYAKVSGNKIVYRPDAWHMVSFLPHMIY